MENNQVMANNPSPVTPPTEQPPKDIIEKAAEELNIKLPSSSEPLIIRIIALILLVGGLSLFSSVFTDIFGSLVSFGHQVLRFITGLAMIIASYGLIKRQRWAIYLYGIFAVISLIFNPAIALFLLLILAYLFSKRQLFEPGFVEKFLDKFSPQKPENIQN